MSKTSIFILLSLLSFNCLANFEMRRTCISDEDIKNKNGEILKFYASLLAYNNEKPRCLLYKPIIASYQVDEASTENDPQTNDVIVNIVLSKEGKEIFSTYSSEHIKEEIALVIDEKILVMLTLIEPIYDGRIQIRGLWYEDAIRLMNAINQK